MKYLLFGLLSTFGCFNAFSQHAVLVNDTARYNGKNYAIGDTITLGYGSKSDKGFAFISMGSALTGATPLWSNCAKQDAIINKISAYGGKVGLRAKFINYPKNPFGGNSLFIDLEGAIDNKELFEKK